MGKNTSGFMFLLLFSIILIIVGVQGNLGTLFAVIFVPRDLTIESSI